MMIYIHCILGPEFASFCHHLGDLDEQVRFSNNTVQGKAAAPPYIYPLFMLFQVSHGTVRGHRDFCSKVLEASVETRFHGTRVWVWCQPALWS